MPDSQSGEVGGVQNTVTNLGASIGTALAGAILIAVLTTTFLGSVASNPAVPKELASQAQVELSSGIPFVSDADLNAALEKADVPPATAEAIVDENASEPDQRAAGRPGRPRPDRAGRPGPDPAPPDRPAGDDSRRRRRECRTRRTTAASPEARLSLGAV